MAHEQKRKLLFVCTANQQRSPTAERLFKDDSRFEVQSAGTHTIMGHAVSDKLLEWADDVVVMEEMHARAIRRDFPQAVQSVQMHVLGIPDIYEYMDTRLQQEIRERMEKIYGPGS